MLSFLFLCLMSTLLLLLLLIFFIARTRTKTNCSPGPRGLPIIGNLHQLDTKKNMHLEFFNLSQIYGPLFSLKLGLREVIVVSSAEMAKVVLKNNDIVFSNRPSLYGQQKLSYNGSDITFSPNNSYWREIRKLCIIHIFSAKRVSSFASIRRYEVQQLVRKVNDHAAASTISNLSELVVSLLTTTICRIAFGRRYEDGHQKSKFHEMLNEIQRMMIAPFLSDYIPFTSWIDSLTGLHARLDRIFQKMDEFYQEVIEEHMERQSDEEVMVDVLLNLKNQQHNFPIDLTFDHIKGVLMDMLVGATGTTAATTIWAMTALIKKPRIMDKVQKEIRSLAGNKDFLDEQDVQRFPYLKTVIKETFRLFPPAPLGVPRESKESCVIAGFDIPAKTTLYVNLWAIHRDPVVWKDPEEFYPERFLNNPVNFLGGDLELIPFGTGRRMCPGISMGIASLELILANLLFSFDWDLPRGLVREDIDTEALSGLVQHKKNNLCLLPRTPI